ncbi:hypothetical protein G1C97_0501 [Bifidobacterium sp. DSM 109959]|uniref:Uncharacterized protein n=1 Tax=Bifidobacterium olomucense TaxID=2675324 RepID=A0A7Y0EW68_9BIFI|nr:hypothetical protein [Bifidobacterium sp. DSM 109959]
MNGLRGWSGARTGEARSTALRRVTESGPQEQDEQKDAFNSFKESGIIISAAVTDRTTAPAPATPQHCLPGPARTKKAPSRTSTASAEENSSGQNRHQEDEEELRGWSGMFFFPFSGCFSACRSSVLVPDWFCTALSRCAVRVGACFPIQAVDCCSGSRRWFLIEPSPRAGCLLALLGDCFWSG